MIGFTGIWEFSYRLIADFSVSDMTDGSRPKVEFRLLEFNAQQQSFTNATAKNLTGESCGVASDFKIEPNPRGTAFSAVMDIADRVPINMVRITLSAP